MPTRRSTKSKIFPRSRQSPRPLGKYVQQEGIRSRHIFVSLVLAMACSAICPASGQWGRAAHKYRVAAFSQHLHRGMLDQEETTRPRTPSSPLWRSCSAFGFFARPLAGDNPACCSTSVGEVRLAQIIRPPRAVTSPFLSSARRTELSPRKGHICGMGHSSARLECCIGHGGQRCARPSSTLSCDLHSLPRLIASKLAANLAFVIRSPQDAS